MRILAVDDDASILELLPMVAARGGFKDVSTAPSGEIALDMLRDEGSVFDCLLFDVSMPGMDGIELCALTRALPAYATTPIIMLTAMTEKSLVDRAFSAGATDYANKPFDIVELSARLQMAERMVAVQRDAKAVLAQTGASEQADEKTVSLSLDVLMDGIDGFISYGALQNYLAQLSVIGMACSQVLAFKIDEVTAIHARASGDEFLYALSETAGAIAEALRTDSPMMTYVGNGVFLAVTGKATLESSEFLESEIQSILDERDIQFDDGKPLDIEISIGNPVRPDMNATQRAPKSFERAIARAEQRSASKSDAQPAANNVRLIGD